ncbi:MAG: hypothetical protein ACKO1M_09465 [Planctomycetota bacterium]
MMPDRSRLKLMILSCPKTGNAWLRQLLHFSYGVPVVGLPAVWSDAAGSTLPDAFVGHQHLAPTEQLVRWIAEHEVTVLSTIRHPGDTLISYFHYARWQEPDKDRSFSHLQSDGEEPGKATLRFAAGGFAQAYDISLAWARLGAEVVRYEDLVRDPVSRLRALGDKVAPIPEEVAWRAAVLCQPASMVQSGQVDRRHIRTGRAGGWQKELTEDFVEAMAGVEPFRSACTTYDYHWDRTAEPPAAFDYAAVDPFHGRDRFDNGAPVGPFLAWIYLKGAPDAVDRWPDPRRTEGDSFWNWLISPAADAGARPDLPAQTYTNLMEAMHRRRSDLQAAYPEPAGADRIRYVEWFIGQAVNELRLPWALVAPVGDAHRQHLLAVAREIASARA